MIETLEQSLNGGYGGLFGEVVTNDIYELKKLQFTPDVIIDLGSNIGVFTRYVRELFPNAQIISVEPDGMNREVFEKFTKDDNNVLIPKAIGNGKIWKVLNAPNGAHESYLCEGFGFPIKGDELNIKEITSIETIMLSSVIKEYVKDGMKSVVKIDVEGAENLIFTDDESMELLHTIDYVAMEIHWYALTGNLIDAVCQKTFEALASFIPTHNCRLINTMFYATKR
jgi:FkbM family methyltransferase